MPALIQEVLVPLGVAVEAARVDEAHYRDAAACRDLPDVDGLIDVFALAYLRALIGHADRLGALGPGATMERARYDPTVSHRAYLSTVDACNLARGLGPGVCRRWLVESGGVAFELRSVDKTRLSTSIAEQLGEAIRTGGYPPGSALPAERILAEKLNVSRGSVREAIRILEHIGLLDVRTGSGTFVRADGLPKVSLLRLRAASVGEHSPLDVMTARRALEPVCAELAARDRTEHDLAALRASVEEHGRLLAAGGDTQDVDLTFHRAVATASHNPVLELLVDRLVEIMDQGTWRALKIRVRARPGAAEVPLAQHERILDMIERQDAAAAVAAMNDHLSWFEESLLVGVDD